MSPLAIVEGTVLDYNLHFRVIFGEFLQTYEGARNDMTSRCVDAIALGPNGNLQGGIRCFSLSTGRVLQRQWQDVEAHKMPVSAISRINYMCKKQKSVRGLKFGDRQNLINDAISTGVEEGPDPLQTHNIPYPHTPSNAIQHDILIEDDSDEINEEASAVDQNADGIIDEVGEVDAIDPSDVVNDNENMASGTAVENRNDEILDEQIDGDDSIASIDSDDEARAANRQRVTRSGRVSKPCDYKTNFPGTAHTQVVGEDGRWLKPYYYDELSMVDKLGSGIFCSNSYFSDEVIVDNVNSDKVDSTIERWDDHDQYQLYHEALQWLNYTGDEVEGLCLKTKQHSIQQGIKAFGEKGKESAMKEMKNLAIKNDCFDEVEYELLTDEQKNKALPMLMFMIMKRNGLIKSRGVANGNNQKLYQDSS